MSTYTILTIGARTDSSLQTTLRNNNGKAKAFYALIKDATAENEVEVCPCQEDYSAFTANPFLCQLPEDKESVGELQSGDVLSDAISNDNESN